MGFGYTLTCTDCGYTPGHLNLGCGQMGRCWALAVCRTCRTLGRIGSEAFPRSAARDDDLTHCDDCGELLEALARPDELELDAKPDSVSCPKCTSILEVTSWSLWD